ncbi:MAG TPA: GGDEF domain-containing protein [Gemmatimonadaceae bacterium]|nr:GGDEF domain-containing protein [Gemmatimonadaceae bacterium]
MAADQFAYPPPPRSPGDRPARDIGAREPQPRRGAGDGLDASGAAAARLPRREGTRPGALHDRASPRTHPLRSAPEREPTATEPPRRERRVHTAESVTAELARRRAASTSPLSALWRELRAVDDRLHDAGVAGELVVARIRLLLTALLLTVPLRSTLVHPDWSENYVGLAVASVAVAFSTVLYLMVRHGTRWGSAGLASTIADVTAVSLALTTYLVLGEPHTAVNSKVVFEVYFLAIAATCLRYDPRLSVLAGVTAIAQYATIVGVAAHHWDLNAPRFAPFPYGMFDWTAQVSRLFLLAVATVLSTAIVIRGRHMRHRSAFDPVTGVLSRGYFQERMADALSRARRDGRAFSLAIVDLDGFKQFNDRYGHAAGDAVLRAVATRLRQSVRQHDMVARYGGDEFVVLFAEMVGERARERLDVVRERLADMEVAVSGSEIRAGITLSAGISTWGEDGHQADDLLLAADERLFDAKRAGRNRVVAGRTLRLEGAPPIVETYEGY